MCHYKKYILLFLLLSCTHLVSGAYKNYDINETTNNFYSDEVYSDNYDNDSMEIEDNILENDDIDMYEEVIPYHPHYCSHQKKRRQTKNNCCCSQCTTRCSCCKSKRAITGTVIGAGVGAGIGAGVATQASTGALIGGPIGALAGFTLSQIW
jgi:hypothetical protein